MFMKKLASLLLALTLCASLALPALAAEGEKISADTGAISEPTQETTGEAETAPASAPVTAPETGQPVISFTDIPEGHSFYSAIMDCAAKGITSGYADGTFRPTNSVTRAQFCVMLSRAFYPNEVKTHADAKTNWFSPNIQALSRAGILTGTSFVHAIESPSTMNQAISRYDMAALMTNIMTAKGFSATAEQMSEAQEKIADYKSSPTQYQDAVKNVFALGIITGYSDGAFGGENAMNRGQGCVVIYRMAQYTPTTSEPVTSDTNSGTPVPPPPKPETPAQPETPAAKTLSNGKPVTEENVIALLNELRTKYPTNAPFPGYQAYPQGNNSTDIKAVTNKYTNRNGVRTSTTAGCGGWAAFVSDYIFGQSGFPARQVNFKSARPGDMVIILTSSGQLQHVQIVTSQPHHEPECELWRAGIVDASDDVKGDVNTYTINWSETYGSGGATVYDDGFLEDRVLIFTRYPS